MWNVYMVSGGGAKIFLEDFETEEEAKRYCIDSDWTCVDENGFEWDLIYAYSNGCRNAHYTTDDDDYTPSCTNRDYGPSNPWDAPGMSIHDFI